MTDQIPLHAQRAIALAKLRYAQLREREQAEIDHMTARIEAKRQLNDELRRIRRDKRWYRRLWRMLRGHH